MLTNLNFKIDINELREYYNTVVTEFDHLMWSWSRYGNIVKQWSDAAYSNPDNLKTYGWAIQSNLKNENKVCPPWNISSDELGEYKNTSLAFGIILRLQKVIPYAYRWAISVQPPGGTVSTHTDHESEYTVWIPIYTSGPAITFINQGIIKDYQLESNGNVYLLDTTVSHYTRNDSDKDRVAIIFRLNRSNIDHLLKIVGNI